MENVRTSVKAHCIVKCPISNIKNGCIVIFMILTSSTSDRSAQKWVYFIQIQLVLMDGRLEALCILAKDNLIKPKVF